MTASGFAPAKINLTLHVTGQRADGYHLLDSLVVFADVGDSITAVPASQTTLSVTGPYAGDVPTGGDNLVLRAANLIGAPPVAITLKKNLPAASGIGGGSSDAAATLRVLAAQFDRDLPHLGDVATLGADVPVCLMAGPCRMSGIGEKLDPLDDLPPMHLVLVNPGISVATPTVFSGLVIKDNGAMPDPLPTWQDAPKMARWLSVQRNDLEMPARSLVPAIGVVMARIGQTEGCLLARMSGSGATCFGLYATRPEADVAAASLSREHPNWWITSTSTWQQR